MSRLVRFIAIILVLTLCFAGLATAAFSQTLSLKFGSATTAKSTVKDNVYSADWLSKAKFGNTTKYYYPTSGSTAGAGIIPSNAADVKVYTSDDYAKGFPSDISSAGGIVWDNKLFSQSGSDRPWVKFSPSGRDFGISIAGTFTSSFGQAYSVKTK